MQYCHIQDTVRYTTKEFDRTRARPLSGSVNQTWTCDKSDNESGDSSGRNGDDQGLETEEDDACLHRRTVRPLRDSMKTTFLMIFPPSQVSTEATSPLLHQTNVIVASRAHLRHHFKDKFTKQNDDTRLKVI